MQKRRRRASIFQIIVLIILIALLAIFFVVRGAPKGSADVNLQDGKSVQTSPVESQTENLRTVDRSNLVWPEDQTIKASILMYHHIGPLPQDADDIRRGLTVSLENFENQMKFLKQNKFNVITMKQMFGLVAEGKIPPKTVVLTFDDGYEDNYLYAEPVLDSFSFKATFNIITSDIGQDEYMTLEEIIALSKKGNELASHTVTHPSLETLSGEKLKSQLVDSKAELEKITGEKVLTLCYPAGKFNSEVEMAAKDAGYKMAVTTEASKGTFSTSKPYEIPRYRINPTTDLSSLLK